MRKKTTTKPRHAIRKKPKKRTGPKLTRKGLKDRYDRALSWYMRLVNSDEQGLVKCYTCEAVKHWTEMDNGHFVSRRHPSTRWRTDNCRPQCTSCNRHHSGRQWLFGQRLDEELGAGHAARIHELSKQPWKYDEEEIKARIDYYEAHVASILARRIERDSSEHSRIPTMLSQRIHIPRP